MNDEIQIFAMDVEWSKKRGCIQPLEIAVTPVGRKGEAFFSYIRPSIEKKLRGTIFRFLRVKKKTLMGAPDFNSVMESLSRKLNRMADTVNIAVVWHPDSRENFTCWCREYGVKNPFHAIISLREIIIWAQDRKGMKNDFSRLLLEYDVKYSPANLNNSQFDVEYLSNLFSGVKDRFDREKPWEWLVSNTDTGIVHKEDCSRIKIKDNRYRRFETEDLYMGYRFCRICGRSISPWVAAPSREEKRMIEIKNRAQNIPVADQFLDRSIAEMCLSFGFEYSIHPGLIEIQSSCGKWKIYHDDEEITRVYHGNHAGRKDRKGVHEQKVASKNLYAVMKYIDSHDSALNSTSKAKLVGKGKERNKIQSKKVAHHTKRNYYREKDEWEDYYD